jgi:hypothetical protein
MLPEFSGKDLDRFGINFKGYSPYGICFAFILLGTTTFKFGAASTPVLPALVMQWIGVILCSVALAALVSWHLRQWPPWFDLGKSSTEATKAVEVAKPKRRPSQISK